MDDIKLTEIQLNLLRAALGLSFYVTKPTRNWLPQEAVAKYGADVDQLARIGFLVTKRILGAGGESLVTTITDEGKEYVLKQTK